MDVVSYNLRAPLLLIGTTLVWNIYEGRLDKRFMNFVALQPLLVDEAFIPHMKAIDVPFQFLYGGLTCSQWLQSDRPKF